MRSKEKSFEELLLAGMQEVVEIAEGRRAPSRVHSFPLTARNAEASKPAGFDSARIVALRKRLGYSQKLFADALNVSLGTVRSWEQGSRVPDGASTRLLEVIEANPDLAMGFVHARSAIEESEGARSAPSSARAQLAAALEAGAKQFRSTYAPHEAHEDNAGARGPQSLDEIATQIQTMQKQLDRLTKLMLSVREDQAIIRREVVTTATASTPPISPPFGSFGRFRPDIVD